MRCSRGTGCLRGCADGDTAFGFTLEAAFGRTTFGDVRRSDARFADFFLFTVADRLRAVALAVFVLLLPLTFFRFGM
jgi:hypothetical protein